ncbi:ceramide glucosyltransferase [Singulisphaera sp. GP187]|uniref:ceramide glucosyltransferase n=1 Tax=Singulisphaera sp. GP187 TaxID=1882752 RepID=UPI0009259EC7|nr:ceramide glucosyltransferase [Singulisphaera sp. GP187]SIN83127.1 ceramide glucosyltransferase [Singulisphaera sp. GP187]
MAMVNANYLLGLIAIFAVTTTLFGMISLFWATRRRTKLPDFTPPISIYKPLKGQDEGLEANLRSFFALDYPTYQLLFCVADNDDPAIPIVGQLLAEYPEQDAQLIVGCPSFGLNPKVESLAAMDRYRRHDTILISDSNVRVRPNYLRETACYLAEPGVGLVTNLFVGVGEVQTGAVLENLELNGFIAGGVAAASLLRMTCVVGKSMLMPARVLEAIGGFAAVRNLLAEDQVIGMRVRKAGYGIRLSHHVIENVNQTRGFRWFLNRHSRWYKIRRRLAFPTFVIEPTANLATIGLVWALSGETHIAWGGLIVLVGLGIARDAIQTRWLRGTFPRMRHLLLSPAKDLFLLPVWFDALVNDRVQWRGHRFRIGRFTRLRATGIPLTVRRRMRRVQRLRSQHEHEG